MAAEEGGERNGVEESKTANEHWTQDTVLVMAVEGRGQKGIQGRKKGPFSCQVSSEEDTLGRGPGGEPKKR